MAAWLAALLVATTVTWQIVGAADDRIGIRAGAPLDVAAPGLPTSTAPGEPASTSSPTTTPSHGTTSLNPTVTSSPPVVAPEDPGYGPETVVIPTVGGTVTIRVAPGSVTYLSAVPNPGFAVAVDDPGPPEVRVELVGETSEVRVRARWRDGSLDLRVDVD